jgi:hypothetical protein
MPAFDYVMPTVHHRICVRHLYANYRDIGGHRGVALKDKLWAAVSAYTEGDFLRVMGELKRMKSDALSTWPKLILVHGQEYGLLRIQSVTFCKITYVSVLTHTF